MISCSLSLGIKIERRKVTRKHSNNQSVSLSTSMNRAIRPSMTAVYNELLNIRSDNNTEPSVDLAIEDLTEPIKMARRS